MKTTLAIAAAACAATLAGCVAVPYEEHRPPPPGAYRGDRGDRDRDGVPDRLERQRMRDRDRDGVPNRYDRDRDGDGVPNRFDRRPNDPRRD